MSIFEDHINRPIKRSQLRRQLGRKYYTMRRRYAWFRKAKSFAKKRSDDQLAYLIKAHKSFLLRPLKDVDMQLQYNKITNLKLAIDKINKVLIYPGQTFSIWYLVGNPTAKRGYLPGLVLNQGKIESGIGGGLCQLGNLLFWMCIHSPLTIHERYRHGYDVFPDINRKVPFGAGATLSYNYVDLQVKNETDQVYQINLFLTDEYLNGEIRAENPAKWTFEIYESDHRIVHQSWGGYTRHNRVCRKTLDKSANVIKDEVLLENHAIMMYEPLLNV